ncbi:MAG: DUF1311 domain-containing protein [Leptospira sp.]|nr:DUF1311 domain-containing protein [Leptospira sp.]
MKVLSFLAVCFLFSLIGFSIVAEPNDECKNIGNEKTKKICYTEAYKKSDKLLNSTYKEIKSKLSGTEEKELISVQRDWILYRDSICEGPLYSHDTSGLEISICKLQTTDDRIGYLRTVWKKGNFPDTPAGEYLDGFGGNLRIMKVSENKYEFSMEVVRGPTAHIGEVSGHWQIKQNTKWRWKSDPECQESDMECCVLEFKSSQVKIEVKEVSCNYYHGARAYFDGIYRYKFR